MYSKSSYALCSSIIVWCPVISIFVHPWPKLSFNHLLSYIMTFQINDDVTKYLLNTKHALMGTPGRYFILIFFLAFVTNRPNKRVSQAV